MQVKAVEVAKSNSKSESISQLVLVHVRVMLLATSFNIGQ